MFLSHQGFQKLWFFGLLAWLMFTPVSIAQVPLVEPSEEIAWNGTTSGREPTSAKLSAAMPRWLRPRHFPIPSGLTRRTRPTLPTVTQATAPLGCPRHLWVCCFRE